MSERPVVGVGVVIRDQERILLIKRGRDPGKGLWAVPGGKVRRSESLIEAARREAFEETGLDVSVGDVVWVGEVIEETHHLVLIDFEAVVVGGDLVAGDDADDARWVSFQDLGAYELTPTMYDLISTLSP